jgi:hypothetical protein
MDFVYEFVLADAERRSLLRSHVAAALAPVPAAAPHSQRERLTMAAVQLR